MRRPVGGWGGGHAQARFRALPSLAVMPWAELKAVLRAQGVELGLVKALQRRLEVRC